MKFKHQNFIFYDTGCCFSKTLKSIRISSVLLLLSFFLISAKTYAQTVTLNTKDASLVIVCTQINQQTGYNFFYKDDYINSAKKVTVNLKNVPLTEALEICFAGQPVTYKITGKTIVIMQKPGYSGNPVKYLIKGRVTDQGNIPLNGIAVMIKGTKKGTTTDEKGEYSIEVTEKSVLIFRIIGFKTREIPVAGKTELNVSLQEEAAELNELEFVSTGYQKIRPEQSTGSLSTIKSREFESRVNTTDFLAGLQNKLPGLLINNDVEFEGNSLFQIRGISTINGSKSPLIVVDGYPTELSLENINPNEIESVTVLKDAAAATIYGVRASNGVIVIERKKAISGKVRINFRATTSITPKENYSNYRWAKDASSTTVDYLLETNANLPSYTWSYMGNSSVGALFNYPTPVNIYAQKIAGVISEEEAAIQIQTLKSYNNTDDYSKLFLRTASTQTYNMDFSGGDDNMLYYITANFSDTKKTQVNNGSKNFKLSARANINLTKLLSMELSNDFNEGETKSAPVPNITTLYPYERFQDEDGNPMAVYNGSYVNPYYNAAIMSLGLLDNLYYPLTNLNEISDRSNSINNRISARFRYKIGNGFNFTFGGVYEISRSGTKHLAGAKSSEASQLVNRYTKNGTSGLIFYVPKGDIMKQQKSETNSYTVRAQLDYEKKISENHSLNIIFGGEIRNVINQSSSSAYFGYSDQTLLQQPVDYVTLSKPFSATYASLNPSLSYTSLFAQTYSDNRYISAYSNLAYIYKNKYTLTGSIRMDQSNLFGTNSKYKYKPLWSLGAGWNIKKEEFISSLEWLKSLKLRAALGFNGNVAKNALPQIIASDALNALDGTLTTLDLLSPANSKLRWEKTYNTNIGLDFSVLKNISGNIDYYIKKSSDVLANNEIDPTKGVSSAMINKSTILNTGVEFNLHADWISNKRMNWNTGFIFSYNRSKILQVYNTNITPNAASNKSYLYSVGDRADYLQKYPIGAIFTYRYAGVDTDGRTLIYGKDGTTKHFDEDN
ncbi:MAG: SusC/RagA family TonB-linked outer membrane protein [Bacteroidales bacterium]|nr:SusC/RagA family TonB-linked outer membrane protein [Bacteroidales bacterium]